MFATTGDILRMSLAIGFIVLVIFLCILIFYTILVMRDASKVSENIEDLVSRIHKSVIKPISAFEYVMKSIEPYVESLYERKKKKKKNK